MGVLRRGSEFWDLKSVKGPHIWVFLKLLELLLIKNQTENHQFRGSNLKKHTQIPPEFKATGENSAAGAKRKQHSPR